jgi:Protein of unknown function (DUF2800)
MSEHAILGASGAKKWTTCTMSAAMEKGRPDDGSDYAREGTCAHGVAEARLDCWLRGANSPDEERGEREQSVPDYAEFYNAKFSDYVDQFVGFVKTKVTELRQQHGTKNVTVLLEQRLRFDKWVPEGFGTGDVVIIVPQKIIVVDLKFGAGVFVDGEDNEQLKLYALGAWDTYDILYDFDEVEVWIHQPRKDNVSGETISVHDINGLLAWADELIVPRAKIAWAAYNGDRSEARFNPGTHCNTGFCKARFTCAARARKNLELTEMPFSLDEPDTLTVDQMERVTTLNPTFAKWAKDVESYLLKQADLGAVQLKLYRLGYGRSNRVITDVPAAAQALMKEGFAAKDIFEDPDLRGITALEDLVGKKKLAEVLGELIKKPDGAKKLVPIGDPAPSAQPKRQSAEEAFG